MRRSLLKLSLWLYLFSMVLPMDVISSISDYVPGISSFLLGIFSISLIPKTPFLFLAWATNILVIIVYVRGLKRYQRSRTLAIIAVALAPTVLLLDDPGVWMYETYLHSPAFWVWLSAQCLMLIAEFSTFEDPLNQSVQFLVDNRPRIIHREEEMDRQFQKAQLRSYPYITLKGKGEAWMRVCLNSQHAVVQFFNSPGDPGLFSQSNTPPEEDWQLFRTPDKTFRNYPLDYLVTHDEALLSMHHYALTGEAGDAFSWQNPIIEEGPDQAERPWATVT